MKKSKIFLLISGVFGALALVLLFFLKGEQRLPLISPLAPPSPKPLLAYTFKNLKKTSFPISRIALGRIIQETDTFRSQIFYFSVPKTPGNQEMKKVSGLMNIPKANGTHPIVVMLRGFVPSDTYRPGVGTQPAARVFAQHGFITLAPDFLGYGESDGLSNNVFEDRFQTYATTLTLLSSLSQLNEGLSASYSGAIKANTDQVGIWGHSNGGHIALATLAISGKPYPTILWAPVSKSFPYSILAYTDEADDQGKSLRKNLATFEKDYDTEDFSPLHYLTWISAPLQIHQGTADHEVPVWWSDELVTALKKQKTTVTYFTYPGADHNLSPTGWNEAVAHSVDFYTSYFSR